MRKEKYSESEAINILYSNSMNKMCYIEKRCFQYLVLYNIPNSNFKCQETSFRDVGLGILYVDHQVLSGFKSFHRFTPYRLSLF